MIGISERTTKSNIHVFRVYYTADPMKRDEKVLDALAEGMVGGRKGRAWLSEMEINWTVGSGLGVYSEEFNREWHVAKGELEWIPELPVYRGWDMGPTHVSPACVTAQLDYLGRLAVMTEIVTWSGRGDVKQAFADQFCEAVNLQCNQDFPNAHWIDVVDPAAWTKQTVTSEERSAVDIMNRYGIYPVRGAVTFTARKDAMYNRLSRSIQGSPSFRVDPSCRMIIEGLAGKYQYRQLGDTGRYDVQVVEKNAWSHVIDAVSYIVSYLYHPVRQAEDHVSTRRSRRSTRDRVTGY